MRIRKVLSDCRQKHSHFCQDLRKTENLSSDRVTYTWSGIVFLKHVIVTQFSPLSSLTKP